MADSNPEKVFQDFYITNIASASWVKEIDFGFSKFIHFITSSVFYLSILLLLITVVLIVILCYVCCKRTSNTQSYIFYIHPLRRYGSNPVKILSSDM